MARAAARTNRRPSTASLLWLCVTSVPSLDLPSHASGFAIGDRTSRRRGSGSMRRLAAGGGDDSDGYDPDGFDFDAFEAELRAREREKERQSLTVVRASGPPLDEGEQMRISAVTFAASLAFILGVCLASQSWLGDFSRQEDDPQYEPTTAMAEELAAYRRKGGAKDRPASTRVDLDALLRD